MKERYLETVLPAIGNMCLVLRGEHKGLHATLLERRKETEEVVLQLTEDLEVVVLLADFVASLS